jgi:hypothetical protein
MLAAPTLNNNRCGLEETIKENKCHTEILKKTSAEKHLCKSIGK